jgi:PAS domain S-box-containing protein
MSALEPMADIQPIANDAARLTEGAPIALAERAAKIGYWRFDVASKRRYWSPGMYLQIGMEPGDGPFSEKQHHEMVHSDDLQNIGRVIDEAIAAGGAFYFRSRMLTKSGQERIFETHGEVELGPDGQPASIVGVRHDITDLVTAETARNRAEEMYRVMAEQASDIIILHDREGQILFASQALERLLKRPPADIAGTKFLGIIHPDDLAEASKLTVGPKPGEILTATYRLLHGDGHYVWMEASTRGLFNEAGELQNIISVSRDITARKHLDFERAAALARAEAANLAKSTFLANMSHELRTPLNAIIGFADMMRQEMFGPLGAPRYTEYAHLIHESGELLLDLISDVLDMAKIEAGKLQLHLEQVELSSLVHDCLRLLGERATSAGIKMAAELPAGATRIEADRRALKQILLNLLSNAVKFTTPGGNVTVRVWTDDEKLTLAVSDDGIGIPAQALSRLGRPFEQVSSDPTVSKGGTGLGLALVHALANKHGGSARIESEEGAGTTVTVELPLRQDARAAA